ncbi:MAG: long-chain fatty acid--CoA ligase, partial [Nitrososphaerota archaeon]
RPWYRFYPEGVPRSIDYPEMPLHGLLERSASTYPEKIAVVSGENGYRLTYRELNELASRFANVLISMDAARGDRVALFLPNIPQFLIAYYGALKAGCVVTTISPLARENTLLFQLNDSEAESLVVYEPLLPTFLKVASSTKVKRIFVTGGDTNKPPQLPEGNYHWFDVVLSKYSPEPPKVEINPKRDLACLQYTGGTTGTPKGAMLTHFNMVSNAIAFSVWTRCRPAKEVFLTVLPLSHIFGMTTSMNAPIYTVGTIVLLQKFDVKKVLETIQSYGVTVFCGVPTMYALIVASPEVQSYNLRSIRCCISGGSPLPPEVQRKFIQLTGGVLVEGYGLTECSPGTHTNPVDPSMKSVKIGSIGLPWPDVDARIVDLETGSKTLPPGEIGELVIKGPQVMLGYWKRPEETREVLRDGWLYTGDVAKMDEDGYFYIVDRKKDLIKHKGYSVYPREVEDVIYEHPAVKLCAVVGKPDPVAGEVPKAFVVLKDGAQLTADELINFLKERLEPYKLVREVEFRKELPLTSAGKVHRRLLREEELSKASK